MTISGAMSGEGRRGDDDEHLPEQAADDQADGQIYDTDEAHPDNTEQLFLNDSDEPLPWLEADDDFENSRDDSGRLVVIGLLGLLAVAMVLGAIWWLFRDRPDPTIVADGSVISAPEEPYKARPENPGGREVTGTGDTSFAVGQGQVREGRIGGNDAPAPSIDREQASATAGAGTTSNTGAVSGAAAAANNGAPAQGAAAAASGVGVQVGAYSTREGAQAGWNQLAGRFEALRGRSHRILEGTADSGTIFRLQAVTENLADAETLCRSMRAAGGDCQVKR